MQRARLRQLTQPLAPPSPRFPPPLSSPPVVAIISPNRPAFRPSAASRIVQRCGRATAGGGDKPPSPLPPSHQRKGYEGGQPADHASWSVIRCAAGAACRPPRRDVPQRPSASLPPLFRREAFKSPPPPQPPPAPPASTLSLLRPRGAFAKKRRMAAASPLALQAMDDRRLSPRSPSDDCP